MPEISIDRTIDKLILWYNHTSPWRRSFLWSLFLLPPVIATALIAYYLRKSLENKYQYPLGAVVGFFFLYAFLKRYIEFRVEALHQRDERQKSSIGQTYIALDDLAARRMRRVHDAFHNYRLHGSVYANAIFESAVASLENVQALIEHLHFVVESQFGKTSSLLNQIEFEVTFMTESYVDGKITIYAYQNRDRRAPRSLILRRTNIDIYAKTVTAEIFTETRPEMRIIENTASEKYEQVYEGQLDRIKSTVVYPVLSDSNELLGTLVVHCNESNFFKKSDAHFWRQLLEVYAKRVANEKICLDLFLGFDVAAWASAINPAALKPNH